MKQYQLVITHHQGECPALPAGFQYVEYAQGHEPWQCPTHTISPAFSRIADARRAGKQIQGVQGIVSILGYDVRQTLTGYLTVETEFLEREGATGDEYCWSHKGVGRGGWCCYACNLAEFFEVLSQIAIGESTCN